MLWIQDQKLLVVFSKAQKMIQLTNTIHPHKDYGLHANFRSLVVF